MEGITDKVGLAGPEALLGLAAGGAAILLGASLLPRLELRTPRLLITSLTSLGFWIALSAPSGATPNSTDHPVRPSDAPPAPWSPVEGPPPLPSTGAQGRTDVSARKTARHPAVHGGTGKVSGPLFPRLEKVESGCAQDRELAACMSQHPAGRGLKTPKAIKSPTVGNVGSRSLFAEPKVAGPKAAPDFATETTIRLDRPQDPRKAIGNRDVEAPAIGSRAKKHVVQRGDSLWGIAEDILGAENKAKVARFWPAIHRLNRETIGRDPNFLIPGQVLQLPDPSKF